MSDYDFGEKVTEYSSKQKKEIPVWVSPKYTQSRAKAIEIIETYEHINSGDFWILMNESKNGKMVYAGLIISHNACLKLNDALPEKLKFKPSCMSLDKDGYSGSLVYAYINDDQGIYEVGEVSQHNCKNAYPYAMALKRCFDRVVLKNSKLAYDGVYSDSEADEFKEKINTETVSEAKSRIINREEWRNKVLTLAREKNIDFKELAADYNLSEKTTAEEFERVYKDLEGNENEIIKQ